MNVLWSPVRIMVFQLPLLPSTEQPVPTTYKVFKKRIDNFDPVALVLLKSLPEQFCALTKRLKAAEPDAHLWRSCSKVVEPPPRRPSF